MLQHLLEYFFALLAGAAILGTAWDVLKAAKRNERLRQGRLPGPWR